MPKYKRRSVAVEAFQWTGYDPKTNPKWFTDAQHKDADVPGACRVLSDNSVKVLTSTGIMTARKGDYIMKAENGDLYPCAEKLFNFLHDEPTDP